MDVSLGDFDISDEVSDFIWFSGSALSSAVQENKSYSLTACERYNIYLMWQHVTSLNFLVVAYFGIM
ncbi:hypothetical protein RND71_032525 [Anisodus tanguticus]|uniref:Uncharacterized protein n=1 Tax=Anisodus tanguticus TaxID=243964 RepID=A0AAE1R6K6_9SOLA|nr:hypothetical protein RND71_032525 [Anisodus tanguticus]